MLKMDILFFKMRLNIGIKNNNLHLAALVRGRHMILAQYKVCAA